MQCTWYSFSHPSLALIPPSLLPLPHPPPPPPPPLHSSLFLLTTSPLSPSLIPLSLLHSHLILPLTLPPYLPPPLPHHIPLSPSLSSLLITPSHLPFLSPPLLPSLCVQCIIHEHAEKQHIQTMLNNQQLMLRQSLLQNTDLKNRLSQIHTLTSDISTTAHISTTSLKTQRPRTPSMHSQTYAGTGPRYGGKTLSRFDSFASVRSHVSETFFDALDDVRFTIHV